jgi:hypothetical protein
MPAPSDRGVAADSGAAAMPVIDTPAALKEFAAGVEAPPQYGNPAPAGGSAPAACLSSDQVVLGSISYQGTPAFAVRDTATGELQAVDAGDCRVLVAVEGP